MTVGQIEKRTQARVVKVFRDKLRYDYLGTLYHGITRGKGGTGQMAIMDLFREWMGMRRAMVAPLQKVRFILKYGELPVGTLSVEDGIWKFAYSEQYKQSKVFRPLVEFPDVDKTYESKELWQFFASRIPSPEQPEEDKILRREQISEDDSVALLKRFGSRTISYPFQLEVR